MEVLFSIEPQDLKDASKYAYAFMTSKLLNIKECSFYNPNPKGFRKDFVLPSDAYSASYSGNNLPSWEKFKENPLHSAGFSCVACVDKKDQKRVNCSYAANTLLFVIYGNYKKEATAALEDIIVIHDSLR